MWAIIKSSDISCCLPSLTRKTLVINDERRRVGGQAVGREGANISFSEHNVATKYECFDGTLVEL